MLYNVRVETIIEMSIRCYFQPRANLPTPSQVQMSPSMLKEVNQAVTAVLDCEGGNQDKRGKKRKYSTSFTPEDHAAIGRYAAKCDDHVQHSGR